MNMKQQPVMKFTSNQRKSVRAAVWHNQYGYSVTADASYCKKGEDVWQKKDLNGFMFEAEAGALAEVLSLAATWIAEQKEESDAENRQFDRDARAHKKADGESKQVSLAQDDIPF